MAYKSYLVLFFSLITLSLHPLISSAEAPMIEPDCLPAESPTKTCASTESSPKKPKQPVCLPNPCSPDLEFRAGVFIPQSHLYREIYENLPAAQLEASYTVVNNLRIWSNITVMIKEGHSIPLSNRTNITVVPLSLGLKYVFRCKFDIDLCLGAGGVFTCMRIRDHSDFVKPITQKYEFGGVLKLQLTKRFECFYLSMFSDYLIQTLHVKHSHHCVSTHSQDIGGIFVGLSIGKEF